MPHHLFGLDFALIDFEEFRSSVKTSFNDKVLFGKYLAQSRNP